MTELPLLPADTVAAATLGSYCPKLCTFACPVHAATGRDDAVPWGFHRATADLAEGRRAPEDVAADLVACTGCLGCRVPCTYDQDVPEQVRDARAVARPRTDAADRVLHRLAAGERPDGRPGASDEVVAGGTVLLVGCQDPDEVVAAAVALLRAAGHDVAMVGDGCCGQLARDLGDAATAEGRARHRAAQLEPASVVVALDPHCLPALPDDAAVRDLWSVLDESAIAWDAAPADAVTYHDPCMLARGAGVTGPPRRLLADAGMTVVEPEFHGQDTACAGAGMGLPLLDAPAAEATAARRAEHLAATGAPTTVTACSRASDRLRTAGHATADLAVLLASRLPEPP